MPPRKKPTIDWTYSGTPDPVAGTGALPMERALPWISGLAAAALMFYFGLFGWTGWEFTYSAVAALIAFDLVSGAVGLSLNSAKRFFFSPLKPDERGILMRLIKTGGYLPAFNVHPILVYLLFKPHEYWIGILMYLGTSIGAILVRMAPYYLARPLAVLAVVISIFITIYVVRPPPGFEWMLPVLTIKLILGFGVREEPYRPSHE